MEPEFLFIGSEFDITCVFMNNNTLFSGDTEGNLIKWNFETRRPEIKFKGHSKHILNIDVLRTKNQIVSNSRDGYIKFWIILAKNFSEVNRMESNQNSFCKYFLYFEMNREFICNPLNDEDNSVEIIEFPGDIITHHICAKPPLSASIKRYGMVMCISMVDMNTLIVGYESGSLVLFKQFKVCSSIQAASTVICMATNLEGKVIVGTPDVEMAVIQIDKESGTMSETRKVLLPNAGVSCIAFRKDGRIFSTAGWDGMIRVFSSRSYKQLVVLKWNISYIYESKNCQLTLAFNDENYLISGSDDKIICFWDVYRNK